jgi:Domain of unknown function (DUF3482)
VFQASMRAVSDQLAAAATDREPMNAPRFRDQAGRWVGSILRGGERPDPGAERAMAALATRLDGAVREATDRLIVLHGLSGRAADEVLARIAGHFESSRWADVAKTSVIGGLVSGALGGLVADLAAGGLSFGAGALIGGILGALGLGGAAQAYNLALDAEQGRVGWSAQFLTQRFGAALLRYLAVAHFGRGRGDWVEGEYPPHWRLVVEDVVARRAPALREIWAWAAQGAGREEIETQLRPIVSDAAAEALIRLYPEAELLLARPQGGSRPEEG